MLVAVECEAEHAEQTKKWQEKAMIDVMGIVLNNADEALVPVEVEARISESWGGG